MICGKTVLLRLPVENTEQRTHVLAWCMDLSTLIHISIKSEADIDTEVEIGIFKTLVVRKSQKFNLPLRKTLLRNK